MYTSDRPSPVHAARMWTVSPKVTRENGPDGSCLTQMSAAAPRPSVTASDRPSGESATVPTFPSGFQVVSTGAAAPSRPTHHAVVAAALPPDEYASVPLALTAEVHLERPRAEQAVHHRHARAGHRALLRVERHRQQLAVAGDDQQVARRGVVGVDAADERARGALRHRHLHDLELVRPLPGEPAAEDDALAVGHDVGILGPDLVLRLGHREEPLDRPAGRLDAAEAVVQLDVDVPVLAPVAAGAVDAVGERHRRTAVERGDPERPAGRW